MKTDQTRVYLWFMDYGKDAAVVTHLIGLEPTFICIPGQPNAQFQKMIYTVHKRKMCIAYRGADDNPSQQDLSCPQTQARIQGQFWQVNHAADRTSPVGTGYHLLRDKLYQVRFCSSCLERGL